MTPALDILAVGAHPDDVELCCGGLVAKAVRRGQRVAIVDLTAGEASTRGTPALRAAEAAEGAALLGATFRECLGLRDGWLRDDEDAARRLGAIIRRWRPTVVVGPAAHERHPDHEAAHAIVRRGVFVAGVGGIDIDGLPRHAVSETLYYPMRVEAPISFVVDVSDVYDTKRAAIRAHHSQVGVNPQAPATLIGAADALEALEARDRYWGAMAGVKFAEAYASQRVPQIDDPVAAFGRAAPHFRARP
jgi:bacillithiol biosynthesis deacetylase BshB1